MPAVVVDANVVSYLFKRDTRARLYRPHLAGNRWVVSFMTVAELDWWAVHRRWGQPRRDQMDKHLRRFQVYFADRDLCQWWAEATEQAQHQGRPIDSTDAWVAATALALGVPLVTHNPSDFAGVDGLTILSEMTL